MLIGYDAGALLADILVLALLAAGILGLLRSGYLLVLRPALSDVAAAALGGFGAFWLVSGAAHTLPPKRPSNIEISTSQNVVNETLGKSLLMREYKLEGNTLCHPTYPDTC